MLHVEHARRTSQAGRLLNRLLELEFDTKNFAVDWADVTAEEVLGLRILEQERQKRMNEKREEAQERQEMERRVKDQQGRR